jgi:hypothetical protein
MGRDAAGYIQDGHRGLHTWHMPYIDCASRAVLRVNEGRVCAGGAEAAKPRICPQPTHSRPQGPRVQQELAAEARHSKVGSGPRASASTASALPATAGWCELTPAHAVSAMSGSRSQGQAGSGVCASNTQRGMLACQGHGAGSRRRAHTRHTPPRRPRRGGPRDGARHAHTQAGHIRPQGPYPLHPPHPPGTAPYSQ